MERPEFITAQLLISAPVLFIAVHAILGGIAYLIYVERKVAAYAQDRIGPNRVGFDFGLPFLKLLKGCIGLGQPLADGFKFFLKEDYRPRGADLYLFTLAPAVIVIPALIGFAVIPWGGTLVVPDLPVPFIGWTVPGGEVTVAGAAINIGVVYLLAVGSLGIYGIVLGGWASNNKYSFLGGLRASAQMISYELPMGLAILSVLLLTGTLLPTGIIDYQISNGWLVLHQPLAAVIFFICILAEANRLPFDNAECENELVGGYHTEYSSMRFALFFLAEYGHMVTSSAFLVLLFFGGFHIPFVPQPGADTPLLLSILLVIVNIKVFALKVIGVVVFMMLIRWTLPRLRYDQVMQFAWQAVIPLSLAHVVLTAVMVYWSPWASLPGKMSWIPMLAANVVLGLSFIALVPLLSPGGSSGNRKVALAGSRYSPLPGEVVRTEAGSGLAREDRPVEGTLPAM